MRETNLEPNPAKPTRQGPARRVPAVAFVVLGAAVTVLPADLRAVVVYQGQVGASWRRIDPGFGETTNLQSTDLQLAARTPIWQPWFATLGGDVFLSRLETSGGGDSTTDIEAGRIDLNVFPVSRFPFHAFTEVQDSRIEDRASLFVEDTTTRRSELVGVEQSYQPITGAYALRGRYTETEREEVTDLVVNTSERRAELGGRTRIGRNSLTGQLDAQEISQDVTGLDLANTFFDGRHLYSPPRSRFNLQNFVSYADLRDSSSFAPERSDRLLQLRSELGWQSADGDLGLQGQVTFDDNEREQANQVEEEQRLQLQGSANYRHTRNLRISGSVSSVFRETSSGEAPDTHSLTSTVSYVPDPIAFDNLNYSWSTSASASARESGGESGTTLNGFLGHGVSYAAPSTWWEGAILSGSASQSVSLVEDSETRDFGTVTHSLGATLSKAAEDVSNVFSLSFTDSHDFAGSDDAVQVATGQWNFNGRIDRWKSVNSNVVISANRIRVLGDEGYAENSSATLSYLDNRVAEVRGLTFRSELEASSDKLNPLEERVNGSRDLTWRNELEYTRIFGLLRLRATASSLTREENTASQIFLSVTRAFGGAF